jgi:hypothetical protein
VDTLLRGGRANYDWTGETQPSILNQIGLGLTSFSFKCEGVLNNINLKGVHVSKYRFLDRMNKARLMREKGNRFYFLVDLATHGVSEASRKRGGHYLYVITEKHRRVDPKTGKVSNKGWKVRRIYYSLELTAHLNLGSLKFHNHYWRIMKHCYYGVAVGDLKEYANST